jgi:parvulin-like peptidyl-prolyl isomerase
MRLSTRRAAAVLLGAAVAATASAQAPVPPNNPPPPVVTPGSPPPPVITPMNTTPGLPAPSPAPMEQRPTGVAAKVNGQELPEVAVYRALRQFPKGEQEMARKEILNHLIDNVIIDQYLNALKITVEPADVDKLIDELKTELKRGMKDYQKELEGMMLTEAEFRAEVMAQMKWDKFLKQQATDEALKKLFDASPNVFDGSMVRCRHILMTPAADAASQDKAKQQLLAIKQTIEAEAAKVQAPGDALAQANARGQKVDELFQAYAKQYSSCPSKANGGDLNFFPRVGAMVEPFSAAAFALDQYKMSDVVATEFGLHLILCTAKKAGVQRKFEEVKDNVMTVYAMRLREAVIAQMKPRAQVEITRTAAAPTTVVPVIPTSGTPMR